jgi:hypothetical protein
MLVDIVFQLIHVSIGKSSQAQNPEGIIALIDLGNPNILNHGRDRSLHNALKSIGDTGEHVRINESPHNA